LGLKTAFYQVEFAFQHAIDSIPDATRPAEIDKGIALRTVGVQQDVA
jgi:hypothetical protein